MVVLALGGVWVVLPVVLAATASAHPGIENPYLPIHVVTTVVLGVPSEVVAVLVAELDALVTR